MTARRSVARLREMARWAHARVRPWHWSRVQYHRAGPWLSERRHRRRYVILDEDDLRRLRRSDVAFVFGSGASLTDLGDEEWRHFAAHDTIGFNYFVRQRRVRVDFHLVAEMATGDDMDRRQWEPAVREYGRLLVENPSYRTTVIGLQSGWAAWNANRLAALDVLPPGTRMFRYRRLARGADRAPTRSLAEGLVHGAGTLVECVNFAYVLGFRKIVLVGVDLYDSRYFWLPPEEGRPDLVDGHGLAQTCPHPLSESMVRYLGRWGASLDREGVVLSVYNPRSLLASVLPVYQVQARSARA
jgi:hypothetical protein